MKNYLITTNKKEILVDEFSYEFSQIGKKILSEQYTNKIPTVIGANNPDPLDTWSLVLPTADTSDNPIAILTHPLTRFKHTVYRSKISVDKCLSDSYVRRLKTEYDNNTSFYKIEEHQDEIAELLGFSELTILQSNNQVTLTEEQLSQFEEVFAEELDLYNNITVAGQKLEEIYPKPIYVPSTLTPSQFWLASLEYGFDRDNIISLIESLPETTESEILFKKSAKIKLFTVSVYDRNDTTLIAIASILGVTSDEIDEIFIRGVEL